MQTAKIKLNPSRAVRAAVRQTSRAGFTLIEILAVILIIGILSTFVIPQVISAIGLGQSTACQANLNAIQRGFLEYQTKYSRVPKGSGVSFFASLITEKIWDPTVKNSKTLTCPAVELSFLTPGQDDVPVQDWYLPANKDVIDGGYSSYAGRDQKRHPLRSMKGKGKTALVADDNDGAGNHETTTNVLWDDMSVRALELVDVQTEGLLSEDEDILYIPVGPDSPVPALQTLTLD
ncbi:Type II secretion system protein G precursor [Planctomycetes bacterium Poly30]|uniref:Type II secretion system protein G n=1 Tax=Saltatorellus ferox TaxID=2528018 RepID=A0A518ESL0_9BACT|nr:Type II secretion system protein G precursor [Planctomycetes bacterium Poly30]